MNWQQQQTQVALFYKSKILDEKKFLPISTLLDGILSESVDTKGKEINFSLISAPIPEDFNVEIIKYTGKNGLRINVGLKRIDLYVTEFDEDKSPKCDLGDIASKIAAALKENEIGRVGIVADMQSDVSKNESDNILSKYFQKPAFADGDEVSLSINKRGELNALTINRILELKVKGAVAYCKIDINSLNEEIQSNVIDEKIIANLSDLVSKIQGKLITSDLDIPF